MPLVMGQARGGGEGVAPVGRVEVDDAPGGLEEQRLLRGPLVERDRALDRCEHPGAALEPRERGVVLRRSMLALGDHLDEGAGEHPLLAEPRQDVGDVVEIGPMGAHHEEPSPASREVRVLVEQVGRTVQRDDGLARAGSAVDDERSPRRCPDDRVLLRGEGAQHAVHPRRARAAEQLVQGGVLVGAERLGRVRRRSGVEHLVPVVPHEAAGPAVAAARGEAEGLGARRGEEGARRLGAPVDHQHPSLGVVHPAPSDVEGGRAVGREHPPQHRAVTDPLQSAQASSCVVDPRLALDAALGPVGTARQVRGELALGRGEGGLEREVDPVQLLLVVGDATGRGLGGEPRGQVEECVRAARGGGLCRHGSPEVPGRTHRAASRCEGRV